MNGLWESSGKRLRIQEELNTVAGEKDGLDERSPASCRDVIHPSPRFTEGPRLLNGTLAGEFTRIWFPKRLCGLTGDLCLLKSFLFKTTVKLTLDSGTLRPPSTTEEAQEVCPVGRFCVKTCEICPLQTTDSPLLQDRSRHTDTGQLIQLNSSTELLILLMKQDV